jgi:hypothetical protein
MKILTDFQTYTQLRDAMRCMIHAGAFNSLAFEDAWQMTENIKNRHGGMPPLPDDYDYEADNMETAETANMEGRR